MSVVDPPKRKIFPSTTLGCTGESGEISPSFVCSFVIRPGPLDSFYHCKSPHSKSFSRSLILPLLVVLHHWDVGERCSFRLLLFLSSHTIFGQQSP